MLEVVERSAVPLTPQQIYNIIEKDGKHIRRGLFDQDVPRKAVGACLELLQASKKVRSAGDRKGWVAVTKDNKVLSFPTADSIARIQDRILSELRHTKQTRVALLEAMPGTDVDWYRRAFNGLVDSGIIRPVTGSAGRYELNEQEQAQEIPPPPPPRQKGNGKVGELLVRVLLDETLSDQGSLILLQVCRIVKTLGA